MVKEHMPDENRLKELLVGKAIVKAEVADEAPAKWGAGPVGYLTLNDGTVLKVWGNDGGCACSAGCYPLTELNECENIITNVEVDAQPGGDTWYDDGFEEHEGHYRIYVLAEDRRINVASFEGGDGNGYYGTGWWLEVQEDA